MNTISDGLKFFGTVELSVFRKGRLYSFQRGSNLIVTVGKAHLAGLLNGVMTTPAKYIAVGSSATAAAAGDTALVSEITSSGLSRAAATTSRVTTTTINDTARCLIIFSVTGTQTVQECGLFDTAVTGGVLLSRYIPTSTPVVLNDTLQVKWDIKIA
jgi:hypothetical protein